MNAGALIIRPYCSDIGFLKVVLLIIHNQQAKENKEVYIIALAWVIL